MVKLSKLSKLSLNKNTKLSSNKNTKLFLLCITPCSLVQNGSFGRLF